MGECNTIIKESAQRRWDLICGFKPVPVRDNKEKFCRCVKEPIRVKAELHIRQSCKKEIVTEFFLEWLLAQNAHFPVLIQHRWTGFDILWNESMYLPQLRNSWVTMKLWSDVASVLLIAIYPHNFWNSLRMSTTLMSSSHQWVAPEWEASLKSRAGQHDFKHERWKSPSFPRLIHSSVADYPKKLKRGNGKQFLLCTMISPQTLRTLHICVVVKSSNNLSS